MSSPNGNVKIKNKFLKIKKLPLGLLLVILSLEVEGGDLKC